LLFYFDNPMPSNCLKISINLLSLLDASKDRIMQQRLILIMLTAVLSGGCTVGPDYVKPSVAVPVKFKETAKNWQLADPRDERDRGTWWLVFKEPLLNSLEKQLNAANPTIINAEANYRHARALVDEACASLFPTGTAAVNITRQKSGSSTTPFIAPAATGSTATGTVAANDGRSNINSRSSTSHVLSFSAAWEPDLWGSVHRTIEASAAGAKASAALFASTRLSAQAALAQIYFQVRALDKDQQLLNRIVKNDRKALELIRYQYAEGVAARSDLLQAQNLLASAAAQAINNKISRAQFEHAIAVLIGQPPAEFSLPPRPLVSAPPRIPVLIPSTLLERRPDVAQAERLMAQANAQIGVAAAAYFPTLSLSATSSAANNGYAHWLSIPALGWAIGPQLAATLLDGGLRQATVQAARTDYAAAVASYRQVVLTAFQEVEDNLASLRILAAEVMVQNQAANNAHQALQLVINQYKAGTVPYSSVIAAQTAVEAAEKNAADTQGLQMTSTVGLIKALGGGWNGV
jgi:NodT family efflux transporter outer membrane factor (OMF) lipoprotein